ncbi:MAG: GAF domain-containing protein [Psittacicella sp.]
MSSKENKYTSILSQVKGLLKHEDDLTANLGNITALLQDELGFFWTGFYRIDKKINSLVLNIFSGPLACTKIAFGKGVCGEVWKNKNLQIVKNVDDHPNHIACSSLSKSEIVVPISINNEVVGVLDIDSDKYSYFDEIDAKYLEELCNLILVKYPNLFLI